MCSTITVAASVLARHYVDLTSADAEAKVAERLRCTGLIIFDGLAERRSVLAFATRIMAVTPHRDSDSDGLTTIRDIPGKCGLAGYAGLGRGELLAHTEGSSLPEPPRLLLLACQRPADQGGECLLADGRAVHADLSTSWHEAAVMLSRPRTAFFGAGDGHCTQVFTVHPGGRVTLSLRQDGLARWSPLASPYLPYLGKAITRHQFRLPLAPGQGYLLDNHRWLHARTQFTGDRCYLRALGEPRAGLADGFEISPGAALVPVTSEAA
jgi:hypothetical protein